MAHFLRWLFVFCCVVGTLPNAQAQVCKPTDTKITHTQAAVKYLRRLSLDLRGRVPSYAELLKVARQGYVDRAMIDGMLKSSLFVGQFREYLKDLLTLNITDLRVQGGARLARFSRVNNAGARVRKMPYWLVVDYSPGVSVRVRGADVSCLPEPAKYDPKTGHILCKIKGTKTYKTCLQAYNERLQKKKNVAQEGYVMIHPYWEKDPKVKVKVCGLLATARASVKYGRYTYQCSWDKSIYKRGRFHQILCGCGPNLKWCFRQSGSLFRRGMKSMNTEVLQSMMEQTLRVADRVVLGNRPYTDLLLTKEIEVNGPISHFINNAPSIFSRIPIPSKTELKGVPSIPYYEVNKWVKYRRTSPREAGILTLPFYMTKYATNRGRLHRYHNAFLCQYFVPPAGGLPPPTDKCHQEPNLMKRCGCKYCHTTIEPEASHWGRWVESAWFPLDPTAFPTVDPKCNPKTGRPSYYCQKLYLTKAYHASEKPFLGYLLSYVFTTTPMRANIMAGPAKLVQRDIKNGKIAACGVRKMWHWFVGNDLQEQQDQLKASLIRQFKSNNYNVRSLVKAIVTSDEYRRGFDSNKP